MSVGAIAQADGLVRLGVGGVAERPHVETIEAGLSATDITDKLERLAWQLGGYSDIHARARFRRDLLRRLAPMMISQARDEANKRGNACTA